MFIDVGIAAVIVAFEIVRGSFAAQIAINALVIYEQFARCKEAKEGCPVEAIGDNG